MSSLFTLPGRPRAKWVVFAAWVLVVFASFALNLPGKFADAEQNESTSFLPGDAESTKALQQTEKLTRGEQAPLVVVYRRTGGLTQADLTRIAADRAAFNRLREQRIATGDSASVRAAFRSTTPLAAARRSPDGTSAIAVASITAHGESATILKPVQAARDIITDPGGGLQAKVTGGAGFSADAIK